MEREKDFDNDRGYRNPTAWKKARQAFGGEGTELAELFREVERLVREGAAGANCPRFALTLALAAFVRATRERRVEILSNEYTDWCHERERRQTEAGFQAAMASIFGDDWRAAE